MEVIVDDSQLSLAIGKKGQNVRLAAKLLGWKIDIKSEEEKRQEVESQMAALVAPGAPVSVADRIRSGGNVVEQLLAGGVGTIEKLGAMTPEELEEIPGIEPEQVEQIQDAVNGYYGQYDEDPELAARIGEGSAKQQPRLEMGRRAVTIDTESEDRHAGTAVVPAENEAGTKAGSHGGP